MRRYPLLFTALLYALPSVGAEMSTPDLPPPDMARVALDSHINVITASGTLRQEQSLRRRWESGPYEFNLRVGSARRSVASTGQNLKEWDVALERPFRLPNKVLLDSEIGSQTEARAEYALGDARHEAGRTLLRMWFAWLREEARTEEWAKQSDILSQLAEAARKRFKAGDAPQLEVNQAEAALAQSNIGWQQAKLQMSLAAADLQRQYPGLVLPDSVPPSQPQAIEGDLATWRDRVLGHNHELGMAQADAHVQQLLAERSRADRIPDPTLGLRHSNEMGGDMKVNGVYLSMPISFGQRGALADAARAQADTAVSREAAVRRRLEGDIAATYDQATTNFHTWQLAAQAGDNIRRNADLMSRAYTLGESGLGDVLSARRISLEASLNEDLARLAANESRYRLLLDAHRLWPLDDHEDDDRHDHY
jgi:outer membrane protein TolC